MEEWKRLWVQQMERKGEVVNSRMLIAKREEALNVPEDERLLGPGWVQPFCPGKIATHI